MPSDAGYSGTPLPQKLGIREGDVVCIVDDPGTARELISPLPPRAMFGSDPLAAEVVVLFVTERRTFEAQVDGLGQAVFPDRSLWIAWPKRSSGVATDMTEDVVREVGLPLGLVDNKVCAIDATWSGLRLVWRKELRGKPPR
jgi:bifunctional DNA-binding transcriptional regulator/antitoxin component of YhaV-PrlF toxin-antitoxin module